ncbi:DUF3631 domain-containing protein [Catenulispora sp. NL8]|uniref:DUF3631 domain-containing protein n=1 Tax=Catenulispora pinistramenti TaxID=2705254 RepID=A0ABS5KK70_9ACTN|nr:DUF3631 domain-containing protein [Catenulispora pinistramenti]MBS2545966.1 DUF3631 domain-containing protein [Catenulispora pinistramenti]
MSDVLTVPTGTDVNDLSAVLDAVEGFMARFIAWPDGQDGHCASMAALWVAHTYTAEAFGRTPRLLVTAETFGAGKTRVLEVLRSLCSGAVLSASITPSVLFSLIEKRQTDGAPPPTFLLDEVDRWLDEDLTGLLNVGYRTGQSVFRVDTSKGRKVIEFPTFAPVAVGGLSMGRMPQDFRSRCIKLAMRRKPPEVSIERFDARRQEEAKALGVLLAGLMAAEADVWGLLEPSLMPDGLSDREYEIWSPLVVIGEAASDVWGRRAREACAHFTSGVKARVDLDADQRLFPDMRDVFHDLMAARGPDGGMVSDLIGSSVLPLVDEEHIASEVLVAALKARDDMPWGDWSWFTVHKLNRMLKPYEISSGVYRYRQDPGLPVKGGTQRRGYAWADLAREWDKYPPEA